MRTRRRWSGVRGVWLLCLAVALSGCVQKVTAPPEPPVSVRRGDRAFRDEKYGVAVTAYHDYLVGHTASDPYTARVIYKTALAEYRLGEYSNTLATLGDLDELYPARRWVQVEALRGDAEVGLKNPVTAMQAWDIAWSVAGAQDRPKLRVRVERLAAEMTPQQLAAARQSVTSDELAALLDRQVAQAAAGQLEPAPGAAMAPPAVREPEAVVMAEPPPAAPAPPQPEAAVEIDMEPDAEPVVAPPVLVAEAAPPAPDITAREELEFETEAPAPPAVAATPPDVTASEELEFETEEVVPPPAQAAVAAKPADTPTVPAALYGREVVLAETPPAGPLPTPRPAGRDLDLTESAAPVGAGIRVACLLPLSGPGKAAGERALRGIRLVFPSGDATLMLKDTGSTAADVGRLLEEVARDPAVVAVVGPTGDATAVATRAERLQLPTLLLTAGPARPFAMPLGVTAADEMARLVEYAVGSMRVRRFAVLHPTDAGGSAQATAFTQAVTRRGGTVIGTLPYAPGQLASMANYDTVRAWHDKRDLQGVFVADSSAAVARIAEFLESAMPDVVLLGVSGLERLVTEGAMPGVYGVLFADSFFAGSTRPATREFVARFEAQYGSPPGALEAEAFDAATLARAALEAGARSRGAFMRAVRAVPGDRTASGAYNITAAGVDRTLFVLQVSDGMLREVSGAASPPAEVNISDPAAGVE
jgi:ABC-type branched-subunit amino acid transport system substrate-binding protein